MSGPVETAENRKINIPPKFQERFLRKLGVLEDDEGMSNLFGKNFPTFNSQRDFVSQPKGPVEERNPKTGRKWLGRLPTNIPGINVETDGWEIGISIAPEALPKIQPKK